jgi:hypothetical protein
MIFLFGLPGVAGMTSVKHHAQTLLEMGSHKPFVLAVLDLKFSQSLLPK